MISPSPITQSSPNGSSLPPALAADLGPLFAEVSMYALMAAVLAFRPAGLFSAKA